MKIVVGSLLLISLISCIRARKARVYRVLADDFTLQVKTSQCSGQTACLCYKSSEKAVFSSPFSTIDLAIVCDDPQDAFICARQKIINSSKSNETERSTFIILTSAVKEQFKSDIGYESADSLSFYVNVNDKSVKIGSSPLFLISEFWKFHYKNLGQRMVKFFVSSCEDKIEVTTNNLELIQTEDGKDDIADTSLWETVTNYLYNTGDKALDVATTALRVLAGVLEVDIWGPSECREECPDKIDYTIPEVTLQSTLATVNPTVVTSVSTSTFIPTSTTTDEPTTTTSS